MEIEKGNYYFCYGDVVMAWGETLYKKGYIYKSENDNCLTDDSGDISHELGDIYAGNHFLPCYGYASGEEPSTEDVNPSILLEAHGILHGDRQADYGDAVVNFENIATVARLMGVKDITAKDCCKVLIALKICREGFKHKRDNLVDLAAYADILNQINERKNESN